MLRQTETLLISRSLRKQRNRGNAAFETQEARLVTFPHLVMSFLFCFCFVLFFSRSSANLELPEMNDILKSSLSFMRFTDHQGRTQTELFLSSDCLLFFSSQSLDFSCQVKWYQAKWRPHMLLVSVYVQTEQHSLIPHLIDTTQNKN